MKRIWFGGSMGFAVALAIFAIGPSRAWAACCTCSTTSSTQWTCTGSCRSYQALLDCCNACHSGFAAQATVSTLQSPATAPEVDPQTVDFASLFQSPAGSDSTPAVLPSYLTGEPKAHD